MNTSRGSSGSRSRESEAPRLPWLSSRPCSSSRGAPGQRGSKSRMEPSFGDGGTKVWPYVLDNGGAEAPPYVRMGDGERVGRREQVVRNYRAWPRVPVFGGEIPATAIIRIT